MTDLVVPNHHAHYPGFAGVTGLVAAMSFLKGRDDTASLACDLVNLGHGEHLVDIGSGPGAGDDGVRNPAARSTGNRSRPGERDGQGRTFRAAQPLDHVATRVSRTPPRRRRRSRRGLVARRRHHWSSIEQGLAEAQRVLTPNDDSSP